MRFVSAGCLMTLATSNSKKLNDDGAVTVTNSAFTVSLDAQSVTTFVAGP